MGWTCATSRVRTCGPSQNMWDSTHSTPVWMQAATTLIKQLVLSAEAVEYCKNKVERIRRRVGALGPALSLLHDTLSSQATAEAVEERALQSLNDTLLCLFKVRAPRCSAHARVHCCIVTVKEPWHQPKRRTQAVRVLDAVSESQQRHGCVPVDFRDACHNSARPVLHMLTCCLRPRMLTTLPLWLRGW
jgi:predicted trehalose synthase